MIWWLCLLPLTWLPIIMERKKKKKKKANQNKSKQNKNNNNNYEPIEINFFSPLLLFNK